ncbi:MAG TPA: D-alanyl-D-alanine carboxypeptidase/D-alanyl-D-alanine-endopeptidase [Candidatus Cybelea sp.]|nr:D-alanyl-D-alanine carboxypeptidase/D-alanyl-D-alanine-endopeptidase [Candidatus Cybelea sp.]
MKTSVGYRRRSKRSRVHKGRVFGFLFVVTLATLAAWLWNDGRSGVSTRGIAAAPQRAATAFARAVKPEPAWTNAQRLALAAQLHGAFAPALAGAAGWSLAVSGDSGDLVFDDRASRAVAPASVQKLIVAATALDALGPHYRFHTIFAAAAPVAADGTLDGNLWLVGSGDPSLQSADLRNGIAMLSRGGLRRVDGGVVIDATAIGGPALNPNWPADDDGQNYAAPSSAVSLDGDTIESHQTVEGADQAVWAPMQDVPRSVGAAAQAMLAEQGVAASAPFALGAAPLDSVVLWNHKSAPLATLETHMLYVSDNHYAEQLLRAVGGEVSGVADDEGGLSAERLFLRRRDVPTPGLKIFDGSGLSPKNRIAAVTMARLLIAQEPALYRLLPLGGREGTLAGYDFTNALGRVRAKTGHLSDVSALAGYANTAHHGRVAFAFLVDGSPGDPDDAIVRAVDRLVQF